MDEQTVIDLLIFFILALLFALVLLRTKVPHTHTTTDLDNVVTVGGPRRGPLWHAFYADATSPERTVYLRADLLEAYRPTEHDSGRVQLSLRWNGEQITDVWLPAGEYDRVWGFDDVISRLGGQPIFRSRNIEPDK